MGVIGEFDLMNAFPRQRGESSVLRAEEVGCDRREHETRLVWPEGAAREERRDQTL